MAGHTAGSLAAGGRRPAGGGHRRHRLSADRAARRDRRTGQRGPHRGLRRRGALPTRLEGLDTFAGCATAVKQALLSNNGAFVLALVAGAWAAALAAGAFRPRRPTVREILRNFIGGILMGWGGMTALGCTVGTLLSGVMAGAASGWVFGAACVAGIWAALKLRPTRPTLSQ
nr:YeeE/YedE thiosulfate transporter family protein [Achromobacter xylosoxidans]